MNNNTQPIRALALALYVPPFKYTQGYIFDSKGQMFSDDDKVDLHIAQRVRGWGQISYLPNAEALQDELGQMIAEALTAWWNSSKSTSKEST
jgi:hypothetical protein